MNFSRSGSGTGKISLSEGNIGRKLGKVRKNLKAVSIFILLFMSDLSELKGKTRK